MLERSIHGVEAIQEIILQDLGFQVDLILFILKKKAGNPLGIGESGEMRTPTKVSSLEELDIVHISAGDYHSTAVTSKKFKG